MKKKERRRGECVRKGRRVNRRKQKEEIMGREKRTRNERERNRRGRREKRRQNDRKGGLTNLHSITRLLYYINRIDYLSARRRYPGS